MTNLEVKIGSFDGKYIKLEDNYFDGKFVVKYGILDNSIAVYTLDFRTYRKEKVPKTFNCEDADSFHFSRLS